MTKSFSTHFFTKHMLTCFVFNFENSAFTTIFLDNRYRQLVSDLHVNHPFSTVSGRFYMLKERFCMPLVYYKRNFAA